VLPASCWHPLPVIPQLKPRGLGNSTGHLSWQAHRRAGAATGDRGSVTGRGRNLDAFNEIQDSGWVKGPQPDGTREFGYLPGPARGAQHVAALHCVRWRRRGGAAGP
jgi:hypothetical protein